MPTYGYILKLAEILITVRMASNFRLGPHLTLCILSKNSSEFIPLFSISTRRNLSHFDVKRHFISNFVYTNYTTFAFLIIVEL
jgi:hypothetical protein